MSDKFVPKIHPFGRDKIFWLICVSRLLLQRMILLSFIFSALFHIIHWECIKISFHFLLFNIISRFLIWLLLLWSLRSMWTEQVLLVVLYFNWIVTVVDCVEKIPKRCRNHSVFIAFSQTKLIIEIFQLPSKSLSINIVFEHSVFYFSWCFTSFSP